jgi:alpha-1,6-mannosyltransferase
MLVPGGQVGLTQSMLAAVAGYGGLAAALVAERGRPVLDRRAVLALGGVLLVVAVAVPPRQSHDLWSYTMYGRIVSVHHASPYRRVPSDYPTDPLLRRVDHAWREVPSVYGPGFVALAAGGTALAGGHEVADRLWFQGLAAVAVAAALILVARVGAGTGALALLAVNPLVVVSVVNGGHNDALVGLAVLAAVLLVIRRRHGAAGLVLAGAVLVKVAAALPLFAIALWVLARHGRRPAAIVAGVAGGSVVAGYAVGGGRPALATLASADLHVTGASFWNPLREWLTSIEIHRGDPGLLAGHEVRSLVSHTALTVVLGLVVLVVARRLDHRSPAVLAGASVLAYAVAATYVLPWYLMWGMPALALAWRSRMTWLALAQGALLHVAYLPDWRLRDADPRQWASIHLWPSEHLQSVLRTQVVPAVEIAAVAALVALSWPRRRGGTSVMVP